MRAISLSCSGALLLLVLSFVGGAGCGDGGAHIQGDGSPADRADSGGGGGSDATKDVSSDALASDVGTEEIDDIDGPPFEDANAGDAGDAGASDTQAGGDTPGEAAGGGDAMGDLKADVGSEGGVGSDASRDVAAEKPPATATWTIDPNPMCIAAGAGCMDLGALGGYQITASGSCPLGSSIQLWFPGGSAQVAAGTYTVKPAAGILDVISMPVGMVGVLTERDATATTHQRFWGRSGTVTVAVSGAGRRVTFTGVSVREETSSAMTTLSADVTCP